MMIPAIMLLPMRGFPGTGFLHALSFHTLVSRTSIVFNVGFQAEPNLVYTIRI